MSSSNDLVTLPRSGIPRSGLPIAHMRSVYRVGDVERRLDKLPPKEHEGLRSTYERMIEKGPERFQVKPSGLPVMDHLYDDLPNFAEVLDDVKRQLALCEDSRDALEITPLLLLGPPGVGKTHFARALSQLLGTGMGFISMSSMTAGWVLSGASQPVEGRAARQGVRDAGRRPVRQPGDGGRRDRQGRRRTRLRPARRAVQPARTRHRTELHRRVRRGGDRRQPADLGGDGERRTRHPRPDPQPHERLRGPGAGLRGRATHRLQALRRHPRRARLGFALRGRTAQRGAGPPGRDGAARDAPRLDDRLRQRQARPPRPHPAARPARAAGTSAARSASCSSPGAVRRRSHGTAFRDKRTDLVASRSRP